MHCVRYGYVFLLGMALLMILPSVTSLSLSGLQLGVITYHPGAIVTNHYRISDTSQPVEVIVDGSPFSGITASKVVNNEFDLIIHFPEGEYIPPGEYALAITVVESPENSGAGIAARMAVSKKFYIRVYSYEKDIQISLDIPNINEKRNLTIGLGISSVGYPNISSVRGIMTLYDAQNRKLGKIVTPEKPLPGLESIHFTEKFDSSKWSAAGYKADAIVYYDGKEKMTNTTFLIGNMDLVVKKYTQQLEQGFDEFSVTVVNNWGNPLRNVYAKLFINGQESLQTPSLTIGPWEEGVLQGILEVPLDPGQYPATLKLFFEGEMKEVPFTITIVPKPEEAVQQEVQKAKSLLIVPLLITALIIIITMGIYFFRRRKSTGKSDEL